MSSTASISNGERHFGGRAGGIATASTQAGGASRGAHAVVPKRNPDAPIYGYKGKAYAPFRVAHYRYPKGQSYHHFNAGMRLPRAFRLARYFIEDFIAFGLLPPPDGYQWVRYGPDLLLVQLDDGVIKDEVAGAFQEADDVEDLPLNDNDNFADADQRAPPADQGPPSSPAIGIAMEGLDALNRGDNATAIERFTKAADSGELSPSDRELALVKRAEAYTSQKDYQHGAFGRCHRSTNRSARPRGFRPAGAN